ncbi:MAG: hypothetical protein AAB036_03245 [Elusimicrobiota bacterium]
MGSPDNTLSHIEGTSTPHLKGRTVYEWKTPVAMSAPNVVSVDEVSGKVISIRCADIAINSAANEP